MSDDIEDYRDDILYNNMKTQISEIEKSARSYIKSLRNKAKADYAHAYTDFLLGYGQEPDSRTFELSVMGAQAVRMNLSDIIPPQP